MDYLRCFTIVLNKKRKKNNNSPMIMTRRCCYLNYGFDELSGDNALNHDTLKTNLFNEYLNQ